MLNGERERTEAAEVETELIYQQQVEERRQKIVAKIELAQQRQIKENFRVN